MITVNKYFKKNILLYNFKFYQNYNIGPPNTINTLKPRMISLTGRKIKIRGYRFKEISIVVRFDAGNKTIT